ncbi:MAG: aspartate--tRNA(Asn) ligase [Candidatus Aenigmarchaeota archaeon]|nr:aspartate--tRNA(Asn) ligase [Candidatus Aenigmarchaeota archaeon]
MEVRGFVDEIRDLGGLKFIKLNTSNGYLQITVKKKEVSKDVLDKVEKITRQSVISVQGELKKSKEAPGGHEIIPEKVDVLSVAETPLPLDPSGKTSAELDTRLDWRPLDLRSPRNRAIIRIQSKIVEGMEEYLRKEGFTQVFTPCIIGAASEGGSEVFSVTYFDKEAFLRQDPQLHRELTIAGGIPKIFDLGPSWRAELSHTVRHTCEHRGCAVELAYIKDETDTMRVEEQLIVNAFKKVQEDCKEDLEVLDKQIEVPKTPFPELSFPQIYDVLDSFGKKYKRGLEDYDRESEVLLYNYVKEKHKNDFFFVNKFPFAVKPFYVMRVDDDQTWARSVDMIYKGIELSSGGQREHRYDKLMEQVKLKGLTNESVEWFTKYFRYGIPPMGGFCIGVERLVMQMLDVKNIREIMLFPRTPERLLP